MWKLYIFVFCMFAAVDAKTNTYLMAFPMPIFVDSAAVGTGGWFNAIYPGNGTNQSVQVTNIANTVFLHNLAVSEGIENKIVLVETHGNISIYGYSWIFCFAPLPISVLGKKYIVSSCPGNTMLVIASYSLSSSINVTFRLQTGNVTSNGNTFYNGDILTESLGEYQTLTINSKEDLTGTVVTSDQTVAVFSGTRHDGQVLAYEQLVPVNLFDTEYVVAVNNQRYHMQIVSENTETRANFNNGSTATVGERSTFVLEQNETLVFTTTSPVMTTLCSKNAQNFVVVPGIAFGVQQTALYG